MAPWKVQAHKQEFAAWQLNCRSLGLVQVSEGLDVVKSISDAFVDGSGRPLQNIRIRHTHVLDDPFPDPPGLEPLVPEASPEPQFERVSACSGCLALMLPAAAGPLTGDRLCRTSFFHLCVWTEGRSCTTQPYMLWLTLPWCSGYAARSCTVILPWQKLHYAAMALIAPSLNGFSPLI